MTPFPRETLQKFNFCNQLNIILKISQNRHINTFNKDNFGEIVKTVKESTRNRLDPIVEIVSGCPYAESGNHKFLHTES